MPGVVLDIFRLCLQLVLIAWDDLGFGFCWLLALLFSVCTVVCFSGFCPPFPFRCWLCPRYAYDTQPLVSSAGNADADEVMVNKAMVSCNGQCDNR